MIPENEMIQFAKRIVPKNWNVTLNELDFKYKPGILNLILRSMRQKHSGLDGRIAEVHGPMSITKLSKERIIYKNFSSKFQEDRFLKIEQALLTHGDGNIAQQEIWIYPDAEEPENSGCTWKGTLIHELAHVAVNRYAVFKIKALRKEICLVDSLQDLEENMHGPYFLKAYEIMIDRAVSTFEDQLEEDVMDDVFIDYDMYLEANLI